MLLRRIETLSQKDTSLHAEAVTCDLKHFRKTNLSEPQVPHWKSGHNNTSLIKKKLWILNNVKLQNALYSSWYIAYSQEKVNDIFNYTNKSTVFFQGTSYPSGYLLFFDVCKCIQVLWENALEYWENFYSCCIFGSITNL